MAAADCVRRTVAVVKIILNIIIGMMLPIAMIVIGAVYLNDCPKQDYIPIYVIVLGCTVLVMSIFCTLYLCVVSKRTIVMVAVVVSIILALFNVAWLIAGSIWVFGIYNDHERKCPSSCDQFDENKFSTTEAPTTEATTWATSTSWPCEDRYVNYCCPQLYIFAFVVTIVLWVFMLITFLYEIYNMLLTAYKACSGKLRNKEHVITRSHI